MSKRSFLRKGASLVGGGALLSSAFMPGSSAGAITQDEMVKNILKDSWKYFFARMIAKVGIKFWMRKIEKEASAYAKQKLKEKIKKLIDENFEKEETGYDAKAVDDNKNRIFCRSCRFFNKKVTNLCLSVGNASEHELYSFSFDSEGYRKIKENICTINYLETAGFEELNNFFEKLDYYVTLAKMRELLKNENLFSEKAANEQRTFKTKKNFYVQNKEVNFIQIYGDLDFVNGFKKKQQRKEDDFVQKNKEGENTLKYNLRLFIELKDGKFRESLQNVNDGGETIQKMTKYMKEILKQAEQRYGVKVLGTENKEQNKVDKSNVIVGDTNYGTVRIGTEDE